MVKKILFFSWGNIWQVLAAISRCLHVSTMIWVDLTFCLLVSVTSMVLCPVGCTSSYCVISHRKWYVHLESSIAFFPLALMLLNCMWSIIILQWLTTNTLLLFHSQFQFFLLVPPFLSCSLASSTWPGFFFLILAAGVVWVWYTRPAVVPVTWRLASCIFSIFSSAAYNLVWNSLISLHNWELVLVSVTIVVLSVVSEFNSCAVAYRFSSLSWLHS